MVSEKHVLTQRVTERVDTMTEHTVGANPPTLPSVTAQADAAHETRRLESEFLATISHELRSPLAAIKGYAATLRRHGHKLGRAERDEFLQAIDEASDRLEMLISRLIELSRLESGALRPNLVPVDVIHLIKEALAAAEHRREPQLLGPQMISFEPPSQDSVPPAMADLRLQREALDIVLENAVKYSPGGGVIRVTLESGENTLTIGVHDSGIGIPREHLERIFDRCHRVDTRLTREVDGAGLGLAICKRIMALQGGCIWAESAPDVGSTFSMTLPLAKPNDNETG
jgi:signal transduction histidine kinase